ncbi:hypothetical protein LX36DRAFT_248476 [Colletotrichum falcatum]|nr:hypothetical protein LX36DRAFT_248476 [Colletotrichum falcatum]
MQRRGLTTPTAGQLCARLLRKGSPPKEYPIPITSCTPYSVLIPSSQSHIHACPPRKKLPAGRCQFHRRTILTTSPLFFLSLLPFGSQFLPYFLPPPPLLKLCVCSAASSIWLPGNIHTRLVKGRSNPAPAPAPCTNLPRVRRVFSNNTQHPRLVSESQSLVPVLLSLTAFICRLVSIIHPARLAC